MHAQLPPPQQGTALATVKGAGVVMTAAAEAGTVAGEQADNGRVFRARYYSIIYKPINKTGRGCAHRSIQGRRKCEQYAQCAQRAARNATIKQRTQQLGNTKAAIVLFM